ncbi:leucyl aminopeptidase [Alkalilimnicola ehrlichii]|uniref:Probable cytosol aminopeptidase n=1 Tax=Alkalilimnicola ehrlichii TaxID=351052 RepID=A0A3E0X181_9GAMM|nr:leucyl aminopeptidase [Alkalilimnicola ehrlichii]RFA30452.1 leucyl aminopeptidase [Alkalilimnicola ehrlichii]RFA38005.1 leucyl aminopeptidase [Alkalilimnicola ehrlichii]
MEFTVKSGNPEKQRTGCIVVGVFESRRLSSAATQIDKVSDGFLSSLVRRGDMEGKQGQALLLGAVPNVLADRVLLIGCGRERDFNERAFRRAITTMANKLDECGATEAVSYLSDLPVKGRDLAWRIRDAVQTIHLTQYRFDQLKSKKDAPRRPLRKLIFNVPSRRELTPGEEAARIGAAIGRGMNYTRDLGNLPGNICTPTYLGEQAEALAERFSSITTEVLDQSALEELQMGALLSVARGSRQAPKLIVMQYRGGAKDDKPTVLVGKGVTFDTGGISLKPAAAMDEMKYDMCGAASVFGTLQTCAELELPINVIGIVPATENMPGGLATKPGDVVTSMSGQTIEILNTDAEGRLILCDALTYSERFEPAQVIDIATLTGACVIALGHHTSGLFGNHPPLVNELMAASRNSGDRAWEMPMGDEYQEQLHSNFADMANVGDRSAGSITAACFLSRFAQKLRWAHLDIAGTAWKSGKDKGATGRPVPLLTQFLLDRASSGK